jgi:hypothetical protein
MVKGADANAAVGLPLMVPVARSKLRPAGRLGEIEKSIESEGLTLVVLRLGIRGVTVVFLVRLIELEA